MKIIYIILILIILAILYNFWIIISSHEGFAAKKVKLIIYHMNGCPHCDVIMKGSPSIFTQLKNKYANNPNVQILHYQSGKDKEADEYMYFPTIKISQNGHDEFYEGEKSFIAMSGAIDKKLR